jgi:hypothetical protein
MLPNILVEAAGREAGIQTEIYTATSGGQI